MYISYTCIYGSVIMPCNQYVRLCKQILAKLGFLRQVHGLATTENFHNSKYIPVGYEETTNCYSCQTIRVAFFELLCPSPVCIYTYIYI